MIRALSFFPFGSSRLRKVQDCQAFSYAKALFWIVFVGRSFHASKRKAYALSLLEEEKIIKTL
jgi:hypothetical protein